MRLFPAWAKELGLGEVRLVGCDLPIHAERGRYRELVQRIKDDEHDRGALITTHKIDLFESCRDFFDRIDANAELCGETSCLSKRDGLLWARATDPLAAGRALAEFLPDDHWRKTSAEVLCLGAGGSAIAITLDLIRSAAGSQGPARITVVNRSPARLEAMRAIHARLGAALEIDYLHNADPRINDQLVRELPPGSLVINATGMGKDTPGSPLTDDGEFPKGGFAWELNYRGELQFLHQALRQAQGRGLRVHDGWRYFIHGWTTVIAEVFDLSLHEEQFSRLATLSEGERPSLA
ncbi:MAG: shikimate dehydrogenase [Candidatus Dormibacteraeota bacterium]|nr:shikimate dehydrogenase [Candidatus Dormibacteraeota bacterium]